MSYLKQVFCGLLFLSQVAPQAAMAKGATSRSYSKAVKSSQSRRAMSESSLWQAIHWGMTHNKNQGSLVLLDHLAKRKKKATGIDEIQILKGRAFYQMGEFKASVNAYKKVPKDSDLWVASVEERAWAQVRAGNYNQAIADTKTIMSPVFSEVVTPESYFVSSYVAHRVCNFEDVFKITDTLKKRSQLRVVHLEKLAKMEVTRGLHLFMENLAKDGLEKSLTKETLSLFPKHFYRNKKFIQAIKGFSGPQGLRAISLRTALSRLAKDELAHYREVIGKIHLIEADAVQRMYLDSDLKGKRHLLPVGQAKGKYDLEFKHDENDVWIDEIDKLSVRAKNCPTMEKSGVPI